MHAGETAHVPAHDQVFDAGAEGGKVRRLEMRVEGSLVLVDLVQHHPVRLLAIERDVELSAARLLRDRLAGIGPGQLQELLEPVRLDLELAMITNGPRGSLEPAMKSLPGK
jgi:hypothetical protein